MNQHISWVAYGLLMVLVAAVCFGGLRDHGVFFHDDETFRDNKILAEDLAFFFLPSGSTEPVVPWHR